MKDSVLLQGLRSPWLHARSLDLLACVIVVSVAAVLLTNNVTLPDAILYRAVLPALLLVLVTRAAWLPLQSMESMRGGVKQTSLIALAAIIYLAILVIATSVNHHRGPGSGLPALVYLRISFEIAIYVVACAYAAADPRRLRAILIAIGALVAIHSAINIVMFVNTPAAMELAGYRLFAMFGTPQYRNATHVAPLAAMFGMSLLALVATTQSRLIEQRIAVPCVVVLVLAVLMTQSRGAIVAVGVCAGVIAVVSRGGWRAWIFGLSAAAAAAVVLIPSLRTTLFARADSFRIMLWKSYLKLASGQPWSGFGLDRETIVTINNLTFEQPHNAFVWGTVRGGVLAGMLAALMMLLAVYWTFRYWRVTRNAAPLVLTLALGITAMTEIGFMVIPYNWIWLAFWLPIGLAAGAERAVRQQLVSAPSPVATAAKQLTRPRYVVRRLKIEIVVDRADNKLAINVARSRNEGESLVEQDDGPRQLT